MPMPMPILKSRVYVTIGRYESGSAVDVEELDDATLLGLAKQKLVDVPEARHKSNQILFWVDESVSKHNLVAVLDLTSNPHKLMWL